MNIRSLTRGDGVVIGAAVLLFIASFLDFYSATGLDLPSVWDTDVYRLALPSVFLLGFIAAGLIVGGRFLPESRKLAGLPLSAWGTVLAVSAAWSSLWSLITSPSGADLGAGCIIAFLATLVLAGVAVAGAKVPALAGPLVPESRPTAPTPFGGGQPQPGGYGYPGAQQQPGYGTTPQPGPAEGGPPPPAPPGAAAAPPPAPHAPGEV
ncbi:DUF5336 domain-containing protein, partial [Streptomyces sp. NPDC004050]